MLNASRKTLTPPGLPICVFCAARNAAISLRRQQLRGIHSPGGSSGNGPFSNRATGRALPPKEQSTGFQGFRSKQPVNSGKWTVPETTPRKPPVDAGTWVIPGTTPKKPPVDTGTWVVPETTPRKPPVDTGTWVMPGTTPKKPPVGTGTWVVPRTTPSAVRGDSGRQGEARGRDSSGAGNDRIAGVNHGSIRRAFTNHDRIAEARSSPWAIKREGTFGGRDGQGQNEGRRPPQQSPGVSFGNTSRWPPGPYKREDNNVIAQTPYERGDRNARTPDEHRDSNTRTPYGHRDSSARTPYERGYGNFRTSYEHRDSNARTPYEHRDSHLTARRPFDDRGSNPFPRRTSNIDSAYVKTPYGMDRDGQKGPDSQNVTGSTNDLEPAIEPVLVSEVEPPARPLSSAMSFEKRLAGKNRDKERHRQFDVTESAILEEDEGPLTAKARKAAKKAAKKTKKEEEGPRMIPLLLPEYISVANLATLLKVRMEDFANQLTILGFIEISHDHILNAEIAGLIAMEYNYEPIIDQSGSKDLLPRPPAKDKSLLSPRPPVVTIMGHVDHGKTTLLDWLRKSSIVSGEHGGITQHIGAFSVTMPGGKLIAFLDTPGHAAFLSMRERGANVTDIVVLVVAADDSVKPQTEEAIKHARAAGVPVIVVINKVDKEDADVDQVKRDLARFEVNVEDYGGDTQAVCVSGKTGEGMDKLEEAILTLSEMLDMRAETDGPCEGWILEAMSKKRGRVATVLVRRGTLKPGDVIVAGQTWAKVKTLFNEHGFEVDSASPGTPVEVDGWRDQPDAGDLALQAPNEDQAKKVISFRADKAEKLRQAADMEAINAQRRMQREKEEADDSTREKAISDGRDPEDAVKAAEKVANDGKPKFQEVGFIVKADVAGSAEAIVESISALGNDEVRSKIIRYSFGAVSAFDVDHAAAAGGCIISFNMPIDPEINSYAASKKVPILVHNIIYRLVEDVHSRLSALLTPKKSTTVTAEAEIAQIFKINVRSNIYKPVAGCRVKNGSMSRNSKIRVRRGEEIVFDGQLSSLKIVKKDVMTVSKGSDCGMGFDGWDNFKVGDTVQCYDVILQPRSL